jgi:hypothetical protein
MFSGVQGRFVYREADLFFDIIRNTEGYWQVTIEGKYLKAIPIKTKSRIGTRERIRELFVEALRQYLEEHQRLTHRGKTAGESINGLIRDLTEEPVEYL